MCIFAGKCYTTGGKVCIFPWKYDGEIRNNCYDGHGGYWCPTEVNADLAYNNWDWCTVEACDEGI